MAGRFSHFDASSFEASRGTTSNSHNPTSGLPLAIPLSPFTPGAAPGGSAAARGTSLVNVDRSSLGIQGVGVTGFTTVERVTLAFKSGIPTEIAWALTTLVRLSCSNPETLAFKTVPWLPQRLISIVAQWLTAVETAGPDFNEYLVVEGNPAYELRQNAYDAALILRNLVQDQENSHVLALMSETKPLLARAIKLYESPSGPRYFEFVNYMIDVTESTSSFFLSDVSPEATAEEELLFDRLLYILSDTNDRAAIIPSLVALTRLLVRDTAEGKLASKFSGKLLHVLASYLNLPVDIYLVSTTLDFFYQFCANSAANIRRLVNEGVLSGLIASLVSLVTENHKLPASSLPRPFSLPRRTPKPAPSAPPSLPAPILSYLLTLREPERATQWMRASYINNPDGEVTQISLWKAYESQFEPHVRTAHKLLPAVDFIKNVSNAFKDSAAMVVPLSDGGRKFIIKGIEPREWAIDPAKFVPNRVPIRRGNNAAFKLGEAYSNENIHVIVPRTNIQLSEINSSALSVVISLIRSEVQECVDCFSAYRSELIDLLCQIGNPDVAGGLTDILDVISSSGAPVAVSSGAGRGD